MRSVPGCSSFRSSVQLGIVCLMFELGIVCLMLQWKKNVWKSDGTPGRGFLVIVCRTNLFVIILFPILFLNMLIVSCSLSCSFS